MGSYNFTASAENTNDENLIIIYDPDIAAQYLKEFQRVYAVAKP
jgi:phosphatidylserine/phosphatidylglycerophosphate/cardiolipin synthase-like enzyme